MPLAAGTRFGAYEVLAPLGSGGMGEVYRARDTKLDREVAIKVLSTSFATDPERLRRFDRVHDLAGKFSRRQICRLNLLNDQLAAFH